MNQEPVFKNFCAPRANNVAGARFGRKNRGRSRSCASSRARQGQGRPRHAGLASTNPSYVVRKASSCPLRITNPSDSGHVRLAVRRGTGDNSSKQLGCCTFLMQRRPTLDASTGPCKPLPWQAAVLHRRKASTERVLARA